jgi:hypothetical protein
MQFSDPEDMVRYTETLLFTLLRDRRNWPVLDFITGRDTGAS